MVTWLKGNRKKCAYKRIDNRSQDLWKGLIHGTYFQNLNVHIFKTQKALITTSHWAVGITLNTTALKLISESLHYTSTAEGISVHTWTASKCCNCK